ncbi:hypothetical protein ACQ4M3_41760 [Leptolyngbya sp. AN03gr2]|uniref:hypothetical protein n=1 Tax=unclassified Leptolyngbya TaxID=2650499 RepID=UPI003D3157B0
MGQQTGQYVGIKREIVQLYKTRINDQWTNLVEQVYEQCRNRWNYLIPEGETERQKLRSMCQDALEFSNYYLSAYRGFVLHEFNDPKYQILAVKNLAYVIYPGDQEIADALKTLGQSDNEEVRKATFATQERINHFLDKES